MGKPFCDDLRVTVPADRWADLREPICGLMEQAGGHIEFQTAENDSLWRVGEGTLKIQPFGAVVVISASGQALALLRGLGLFLRYLGAIGAGPHRVTGLHAAMDREGDAAPEIARLRNKGMGAAGLQLTRKKIRLSDVVAIVHRREDGQDTGSLYIGGRKAEVRLVVYDKRDERLRLGKDDPGPLTRYELRVKSGVGASLRDAADPEALFWHYASPGVLDRPEGVPAWLPHGAGFECDARPLDTPAARMAKLAESSADVLRLLALAEQVGAGGMNYLAGGLTRMSLGQSFVRRPGIEPAHVVDAGALDLGLQNGSIQ